MKDYIKELCTNKKIKPVYNENKHTVLSNGSQNGIPVLRIHKIFKKCSRKTAQAIVNYYLDTENRENYTQQIQTFAKKLLGAGDYKIAPLSDNFINALILNYDLEEGIIDPKSELTEISVFSLIQKDFNGDSSKKIEDGIIEIQDDDMIMIDIIIDK